ncbi:Got1/Sft2-like family protein, putative [Bodo saltans]|uniref:Vesicle transport protein n=1 Tax=Bodo saltans TaxID=75058 RepID=A0A0S4JF33_BODSA|nr:Got1/Sft2-like family protein, putative [Bodo saltans]|eukprot:CUG89071.1 Got1/Sft2-like family protein, putative [Bodo saltans]
MDASSSEATPLTTTDEGQWFQGMSWTTRLQGFVMFTALSVFSSFMGWIALSTGYMWKYSVLTTLGQVMSICSTVLLMGPQKQLESMFDKTRKDATLVYLASMLMTLFVAFATRSAVLCALCGLVEYGALVWYSLSYIPYGREMAKSCLGGFSRVVINV